MSSNEIALFGLGASRPFAERVADHLGISLCPHEELEFGDGEHKARSLVSVRDKDVYVVHSLYAESGQSVNDKLCRLLFFLAALRDASAARITAVIAYVCYARGDRKEHLRDPVITRYVAALIEATGTDRVVAMDVHDVAAFENAFRICSEHLEAKELLVEHLVPYVRGTPVVVVSPDAGGLKRADIFRSALALELNDAVELAIIEKCRRDGVASAEILLGDVAEKTVIIVDDLISSGATVAGAAILCRKSGAGQIYAAATHGVFSGSATAFFRTAGLEMLVVTDTIAPGRLNTDIARTNLAVLDATKLFAEAIGRLHRGESMAALMSAT